MWDTIGKDGKRKAGAGIFYGNKHPNNLSFEVDGDQTNQRAELAAFLHVLETEEGAIEIRTDSKYVQLGVQVWRKKWRSKAWYKRVKMLEEVEHVDLWQRVDNIIEQKPEGHVKVTWVKGHALPKHIALGLTTEENIWGNNGADALAGAASALG